MGTPPPQTIFKLNFDGAAKGNPGLAGVGEAIRDSGGEILGIYWGCIGVNTNNVAELKTLLAGLVMASTHGWFPIILEGDSQIILQMAKAMLNGKQVHKVADNWRMAHNLEQLGKINKTFGGLDPSCQEKG
jgi:ribonuclease HI